MSESQCSTPRAKGVVEFTTQMAEMRKTGEELGAWWQRNGWVGWGDQLFNDIANGDDAYEGELSQSA